MKKGLFSLLVICLFFFSCEKWDIDYNTTNERNKIAGLWHIDSCEWGIPRMQLDSPKILVNDVFEPENRPFFLISETSINSNFPCSTNIYGYPISFYWYGSFYKYSYFGEEIENKTLYYNTDNSYDPTDSAEISFFRNVIHRKTYLIKEHVKDEKLVVCFDRFTFIGNIKNCFYLSQ